MNNFLRKCSRVVVTVLTVTAPLMGTITLTPVANAATTNIVVKGSGPTLYWYASNGKRYVFPTFGTFSSWYGSDFRIVQPLSDTELGSIQLGGNVTYKPGVRLIKITTDPKVYAVSRYGALRWITSESVARDLYGNGWQWAIDDVPDEFFVNYAIGNPIYSSNDFSPSGQANSVNHPGDNIGSAAAAAQSSTNQSSSYPTNQAFTGTVSVTANNTLMTPPSGTVDTTLTARVTNTSVSTSNLRIDFYNDLNETSIHKTCTGTTVCALEQNFGNVTENTTFRYFVIVSDGQGHALNRAYSPIITVRPISPPQTGSPSFVGQASLDSSGNILVRFDADIGTTTNVSRASNVDIYDAATDQRLWTMPSLPNFYTLNLGHLTTINKKYYAIFHDTSGRALPAVTSVVSYAQASIGKPTIWVSNSYPKIGETVTVRTDPRSVDLNQGSLELGSLTHGVSQPCSNTDVCTYSFVMTEELAQRIRQNNTSGAIYYFATFRPFDTHRDAIFSEQGTINAPLVNNAASLVTNIKVELNPNASNACNKGFGVKGAIATNGAGTVTYQWERSDGVITPTKTLTFTDAGTQTVEESWLLSGNYAGWMRLNILKPNTLTSDLVTINSVCK